MDPLFTASVYFHGHFSGTLQQNGPKSFSFTYTADYLAAGHPAIAATLPLQPEPFKDSTLLPFFDNLVAEGWLEEQQAQSLGKRNPSRFELLVGFGEDCIGAVSIQPSQTTPTQHQRAPAAALKNKLAQAARQSRASLSGIQPKLALVIENNVYRPALPGELSTHMAKFASQNHPDIIENECLTTQAFAALLPTEDTAELTIGTVYGHKALIIKRFDRGPNGQRFHFEEFNQLLGRYANQKYTGSYQEMADFIQKTPSTGGTITLYRLFSRILAGFLVGNTDMHLKNFALMSTTTGFSLAPTYDQVSGILYGYETLALQIGNAQKLKLTSLKPKHIITLGTAFGLNTQAIQMACDELEKNKAVACNKILTAAYGTVGLKNKLIQNLEKRWNGTFALIGQHLSKKP